MSLSGLCNWFYAAVAEQKAKREIPWKKDNRTLVVIAHPDDEVMFFGPTIVDMLRRGPVFIQCFSNGNYEGAGKTRKQELLKSCKTLGIPEENVTIHNHGGLRDDPKCDWNVSHLALHISNFAKAYQIDTIITFDDYGVSGHPNHIALYHALCEAVNRKLIPSRIRAFCLHSVNVLRKYLLGINDIIMIYLFCGHKFILVNKSSQKIIKSAMNCHVSQMVWYRRLYLLFSRYIFLNCYFEITPEYLEKDKLE